MGAWQPRRSRQWKSSAARSVTLLLANEGCGSGRDGKVGSCGATGSKGGRSILRRHPAYVGGRLRYWGQIRGLCPRTKMLVKGASTIVPEFSSALVADGQERCAKLWPTLGRPPKAGESTTTRCAHTALDYPTPQEFAMRHANVQSKTPPTLTQPTAAADKICS